MTTLVWLGLILAVIVLALVYVTWDIRTTFTKAYRYSYVDGYRAARRAEDAAWADFLAEAGRPPPAARAGVAGGWCD
jgi:hypothetical protein